MSTATKVITAALLLLLFSLLLVTEYHTRSLRQSIFQRAETDVNHWILSSATTNSGHKSLASLRNASNNQYLCSTDDCTAPKNPNKNYIYQQVK